jgi:hypothetical protein
MTMQISSSHSPGSTRRKQALVKVVARVTPWLAPIPSAYFVARSSMKHLAIPLAVVIVVAVIVEFLGLTSVHTWLWLSDWNSRKRKTDPSAPASYAFILCLIYVAVTVSLTTLLEVSPDLSAYAPALFPILALIGAFNLALISQQENRESQVKEERDEQRSERQTKRSPERSVARLDKWPESVQVNVQSPMVNPAGFERSELALNGVNRARKTSHESAVNALIAFYAQNPGASYSLVGQAVNRSKAWVSGEIARLEHAGQLHRSERGIEIIQQD